MHDKFDDLCNGKIEKVEYKNGYSLEKVKLDYELATNNHSEYKVINGKGNKVESYTIGYGNIDTAEKLMKKLDEIIEYDPDTLKDWLNRNK